MMVELAKKLMTTKEESSIKFTKAELDYHEGNYKKALKRFAKLDSHKAKHMEILCHKKLGNHDLAIELFENYEQKVSSLPESDEKLAALKELEELKFWVV